MIACSSFQLRANLVDYQASRRALSVDAGAGADAFSCLGAAIFDIRGRALTFQLSRRTEKGFPSILTRQECRRIGALGGGRRCQILLFLRPQEVVRRVRRGRCRGSRRSLEGGRIAAGESCRGKRKRRIRLHEFDISLSASANIPFFA
jgi:hypothetical protein